MSSGQDEMVAVFVSNRCYIENFYRSCRELIENGGFQGDIVLILGDDLEKDEVKANGFIKAHNIWVVQFPEIDFPPHVVSEIRGLKTGDDRHLTKMFQWHKLNLFRPFFKQWKYVFYLDCNFQITGDISPILDQREKYKMVAPDDDYPRYDVVLQQQFDMTSQHFKTLSHKYNMRCRYFQSGLLLFDTELLTETTFHEIQDLALRHPCCGSNDQGFIALYFCVIRGCWKPLVRGNEHIQYYDAYRRDRSKPHLIFKGA